jgi:hypothetical protein
MTYTPPPHTAIKASRLVVLVPHRDVAFRVRAVREALFARGFWGAWSFPAVVPLAESDGALPERSLKEAARALAAARKAAGGTFRFGPGAELRLAGGARLWGLRLTPEFPEFAETFARAWGTAALPFTLALTLLPPDGTPSGLDEDTAGAFRAALPVFRAAALANMLYAPLPAGERGYSFQWKIGKPAWLPKETALPQPAQTA